VDDLFFAAWKKINHGMETIQQPAANQLVVTQDSSH